MSENPLNLADVRSIVCSQSQKLQFDLEEKFCIDRLGEGAFHVNFLITNGSDQMVVRFCKRSQLGLSEASQLKREFNVLSIIIGQSVSPEPIFISTASRPFMIQSFICGRNLDYRTDIDTAIMAMANLHKLTSKISSKMLEADFEQFCRSDGARRLLSADAHILNNNIRVAEEMVRRIKPICVDCPKSVVHTDLTASNIIIGEAGPVFVDWEGARISNSLWDIAYFLSPITHRWFWSGQLLTFAQQHDKFRLYCGHMGLDYDELAEAFCSAAQLVIYRALCWSIASYAKNWRASKPSSGTLEDIIALKSMEQLLAEYF